LNISSSNNVTISNQTLTNLTITGSDNITFSGNSVISGDTNIIASNTVKFTGKTVMTGGAAIVTSSVIVEQGSIDVKGPTLDINSATVLLNDSSELDVEGDLNITSSYVYFSSDSTISVTNCLDLTNSTISTDLSKLNLIKGGTLNLISIKSGCSILKNTTFIYSNAQGNTCPRYETIPSLISLVTLCSGSSNMLIGSSILFIVGLLSL